MKKLLLSMIFAFACVLSAQDVPEAAMEFEESGMAPSISFMTGYYTRNMGEGVISNPERNIQSELEIGMFGFHAGITGIFDLTNATGYRNDFEEFDYSLGYGYTFEDVPCIGALSLDLTWTYYDINRASSDDYQEIALGISLDDLFLAPSLTINHDYENGTWWAEAAVSHSYALSFISEDLSWDNSLFVYFGNSNWVEGSTGYRRAGLSNAVLATGLSYAVSENITIGFEADFSFALDSNVRNAMRADENNNRNNICLAFTIGMEF